jgi:4-amino-4-deoxy-L-arabinose transferase-like glycosyltransferase
MEFFNKRTNITYYFLAFSVLLFLIGSLIKLNTPSAEWDYLYIDTAQNWAKGINKTPHFEHPPLYPLFLAILFKFFESSIVIARLGNTFCAFLTAFILFRLTSKLFSRDSALWTIIFYFLGPICIQGISIMDVADTSILPLAFVFTANATVNNTLRPGLRNTIILGLGIGFCLWVKVTSSLALIVGLLAGNLAYLIFERKTKYYKIWLLNITSMFIGLIFFLLTWVCISLFLWGSDACLAVLRSPWIAFYSKLENLNYFSKLIYVGYYTFGISIWFSPYFLIICLNS